MLARRRAHVERARIRQLAGESHAPIDPDVDAVRERVADLLRPEVVAGRLREALDLYLDDASAEADAEIEERQRRAGDPAGASREKLEDSLQGIRASRGSMRHDAARAAGGKDVADLRARTLGVDLVDLLERAERVAIAPFDDGVARLPPGGPDLPVPDLVTLRRMATALGEDPDVRGPRLIPGEERCPRTIAISPPGERACVLIGRSGGLDAWGALGEATRATIVSRERGAEAFAAEHPAYRCAAAMLFLRLPLEPTFRSFVGIRERDGLDDALRRDAAIRPRLAWAEASAALAADPPAELDARWRRASGEAPIPSARAAAWDRDPRAAAAWLGEVWALLLEERLRTRWGRAWFASPTAVSWLRDVWIAEPDADPDAMASQAGVGTMTGDAILEACRPPRRA